MSNSLIATTLLWLASLETESLLDILDDEAMYPETYQPEVLRCTCLILNSRGDRETGYVTTAELSESEAFDILCAALLQEVYHEKQRSCVGRVVRDYSPIWVG